MPRKRGTRRPGKKIAGDSSPPAPEAAEAPATPAQQVEPVEPAEEPGSAVPSSAASPSGYRVLGDDLVQDTTPVAMAADTDARLAAAKATTERVEAEYHDLLTQRDAHIDEIHKAMGDLRVQVKETKDSYVSQAKELSSVRNELASQQKDYNELKKEYEVIKLSHDGFKLSEPRVLAQAESAKQATVDERKTRVQAEKQLRSMKEAAEKQQKQIEDLQSAISQLQEEKVIAANAAEDDHLAEENAAFKNEIDAAKTGLASIFPEAPSDLTTAEWVEYIRDCAAIPAEVKKKLGDNEILKSLRDVKKSIEEEMREHNAEITIEEELKEDLKEARDTIADLETQLSTLREEKQQQQQQQQQQHTTAGTDTDTDTSTKPTEASSSLTETSTKDLKDVKESFDFTFKPQPSQTKEPQPQLSLSSIKSIQTNPVAASPPEPLTIVTTKYVTNELRYSDLFYRAPFWLQILIQMLLYALIVGLGAVWNEWSLWRAANDLTLQRIVFSTTPGGYDWYPSPILYDIGTWLGVDFTPLG